MIRFTEPVDVDMRKKRERFKTQQNIDNIGGDFGQRLNSAHSPKQSDLTPPTSFRFGFKVGFGSLGDCFCVTIPVASLFSVTYHASVTYGRLTFFASLGDVTSSQFHNMKALTIQKARTSSNS